MNESDRVFFVALIVYSFTTANAYVNRSYVVVAVVVCFLFLFFYYFNSLQHTI